MVWTVIQSWKWIQHDVSVREGAQITSPSGAAGVSYCLAFINISDL